MIFGFFRKVRELQLQNALMRSALLWYATKENWRRKKKSPSGSKRRWEKSQAAFDRGALANSTLNKVDSLRKVTVPNPLPVKDAKP